MIAMAKPAYLAIVQYSPNKPVIAFVPSRRQCRLTADDILTYAAAGGDEDRFLNIAEEDLQPHLDHLTDRALVEMLKHGIGYYHEGLDKQDRRIVQRLFESGAIQLLIVSRVCAPFIAIFAPRLISFRRMSLGVSQSPHTWLSSWAFNSSKEKNIDTLIIQ
jgi:pre-mRNA-splicing helicase BRR2